VRPEMFALLGQPASLPGAAAKKAQGGMAPLDGMFDAALTAADDPGTAAQGVFPHLQGKEPPAMTTTRAMTSTSRTPMTPTSPTPTPSMSIPRTSTPTSSMPRTTTQATPAGDALLLGPRGTPPPTNPGMGEALVRVSGTSRAAVALPALPDRTPKSRTAGLDLAPPATAMQQTMRDLYLVVAELRTRVDAAVGAAAARRDAVGAAPAGARDVDDALWSERATTGGRKTMRRALAEAAGADDQDQDAHGADHVGDHRRREGREQGATDSPWASLPMPATAATTVERVEAVREVPAGPLAMTVDHLRALLPEGGRLLEARPDHVRLELAHASGPLMLEVSLRSGVVDVRARGAAAAEMAWRVPELAAALQGAGVRLGAFEVQPVREAGESSATDDGRGDERQNSDAPAQDFRRPDSRRAVTGVAAARR